jgi:type IV secretion system protein VirB10
MNPVTPAHELPPDASDPRHGPVSAYAIPTHAHDPDLDANAPRLQSADAQRLNRKALAFLAGIVGLLIVSALWMFSSANANADAAKPKREEKVVIPELPQAATPSAAAAAIPLAPSLPADQAVPLPPLPAQQPAPIQLQQADTGQSSTVARTPSLLERRMDAPPSAQAPGTSLDPYSQALLAGMPPPPGAAQPAVQPASAASSAQFINAPDALLVRGTYIRCVLETRIVTDIPGFTSCVVTEPVYSINGRNRLLDKGSKISGRYDTDANGPRVAVVWDRITTPSGMDVHMASPGVDNLGGAGHPGDYNAHWGSRAGAALMISLISDVFKYEGEVNGPNTTTISNGVVTQAPFDSNTARTMERLANQALDRSINRPATVIINQGTVVNVYVAKDVDFSPVLQLR